MMNRMLLALTVASLILAAVVCLRLGARGGEVSLPAVTTSGVASADNRPPDPVQAALVHSARDKALRDRFEAEESDPAWAKDTVADLRDSLTRAATIGKFDIYDVECKSTMCAANVGWQSYVMARENYSAILKIHSGTKCGRSIYVPEPADQTVPYRAIAYFFDCERRA
jgi:hypothetical protein